MVGERGRQPLRIGVDHVDPEGAQQLGRVPPTQDDLLGGRGVVHLVDAVAAGGQALESGVPDRRQHDPVMPGEGGEHRQQPLLHGRRLQRGEEYDERALPAEPGHGSGQGRPVGLRDHGLQIGHGVLEPGRDVAPAGRAQAAADPPVASEEVDPVACPGGQSRQQQRGVHRGVQSGDVLHPAGRRSRGVEDQDHPAVPLGLPGPHHDVAVAGAGPPVDGPHVVPADVLPQRVELRALAADADRRSAVEVAQPCQPAGQVLAGLERRQ